jgi:hypothetical protein
LKGACSQDLHIKVPALDLGRALVFRERFGDGGELEVTLWFETRRFRERVDLGVYSVSEASSATTTSSVSASASASSSWVSTWMVEVFGEVVSATEEPIPSSLW